ncbi:hypothetical protein C9426_27285 [Serratia sp. S1B]|nr:hypothetical protein C9426_27285 [Serratia sp. S1B]
MYFCINTNRYKTFLSIPFFLFLSLLLTPTFAFASLTTQQLRKQDDYAAAMSKQMRNYDSMEAKVNYNSLKNQINGVMSGSKTLSDGSRAASASSISKVADAARAAGTIAGRFAKASGYVFVGDMALNGLLKGIDWLKDDGSKVVKMPADPNSQSWNDPTHQYYYQSTVQSNDGTYHKYSTPEAACDYLSIANGGAGIPGASFAYVLASGGVFSCYYSFNGNNNNWSGAYRYSNPNYNASSPPQYVQASQQDIQNAIQKYIQNNPNSDITNNIYISAYTPDKQFDLSDPVVNVLASELADGMAQSLEAAAKSPTGNASVTIYASDMTTWAGTATSQIDLYGTGSVSTDTSTSTTINADGTTSTTTTQGSSQSDWPSLCDYAAKFCDWMDWTEKEDDLNDSGDKPEIQTPDLPSAVTSYFSFASACPPDRQIPVSAGGQTLNLVISYAPLCNVAAQFKPAVILMSFLAGAFIVTGTGRRAEVGD